MQLFTSRLNAEDDERNRMQFRLMDEKPLFPVKMRILLGYLHAQADSFSCQGFCISDKLPVGL